MMSAPSTEEYIGCLGSTFSLFRLDRAVGEDKVDSSSRKSNKDQFRGRTSNYQDANIEY